MSSENQDVTERERKSYYFNCGHCLMRYNCRKYLQNHLNEVHPDSVPDAADLQNPKYSCVVPNCQFTTFDGSSYDDHIKVHIGDEYTAMVTYRQIQAKKDLVRIRYINEEFHCVSCTYRCTVESSYKRHMRKHEMGLEKIMTKSCPVCGDDFPDEPVLKAHMVIHRNNRYIKCDICRYQSVMLKMVIHHRRMHTGEKPHLCPFCHYRALRRLNLRTHMLSMHSKDTYSDNFLFQNQKVLT